jgi:hypothetical protein
MDTLFSLRDELCSDPNLQPYELKIRTAFSLAMVKQRPFIDKLCGFVAFYEAKLLESETKASLFEPVCQKMIACIQEALNADDGPLQEGAKFLIYYQQQILETLLACEAVKAVEAGLGRFDGRAMYLRVFIAVAKALQIA